MDLRIAVFSLDLHVFMNSGMETSFLHINLMMCAVPEDYKRKEETASAVLRPPLTLFTMVKIYS